MMSKSDGAAKAEQASALSKGGNADGRINTQIPVKNIQSKIEIFVDYGKINLIFGEKLFLFKKIRLRLIIIR